jgi:DNA polymerase III subunit epsilon
MARAIVFDTETTGLSPETGDRLVELGCVEIIDLVPTGRTFHAYINPERDVPEEVVRVHGLTGAFLSNHKTFAHPDVCDQFLEFIGEDPLIAHNASFDRKFINAELVRLKRDPFPDDRFVDTLMMARKRFPGAANSLDALCKRFNVNTQTREKHGALIDSLLLAQVYLELMGGREQTLAFVAEVVAETKEGEGPAAPRARQRLTTMAFLSTPSELAEHEAFVTALPGGNTWYPKPEEAQ